MATVTAFQARRAGNREAARFPQPSSRGTIGGVLFVLVAFFLLAAGAVSGASRGSDAPDETGAFVLDPSIGSARG